MPHFLRELIGVYKPFAAAAGKMKNLPFEKTGEVLKDPRQMGNLASMMPHCLEQNENKQNLLASSILPSVWCVFGRSR